MQFLPKTIAQTFSQSWQLDQPKEFNQIIAELEQLRRVMQSLKLNSYLKNPLLKNADKESIIKAVIAKLNFQKQTAQMANFLLKNRQLNILGKIVTALKQLRLEQTGIGEGEITTRLPLTETQSVKACELLKKMGGYQDVLVKTTLNPNVFGGIALRAGDKLVDATWKRKLKMMLGVVGR